MGTIPPDVDRRFWLPLRILSSVLATAPEKEMLGLGEELTPFQNTPKSFSFKRRPGDFPVAVKGFCSTLYLSVGVVGAGTRCLCRPSQTWLPFWKQWVHIEAQSCPRLEGALAGCATVRVLPPVRTWAPPGPLLTALPVWHTC